MKLVEGTLGNLMVKRCGCYRINTSRLFVSMTMTAFKSLNFTWPLAIPASLAAQLRDMAKPMKLHDFYVPPIMAYNQFLVE